MAHKPEGLVKLRRRFARLQRLYRVSSIIHSTLEPDRALNLILAQAVRLTHATSGSVVLINPTSDRLEIQSSVGLPAGARRLQLRVGEGITGWVARHGKAARVGDVRRDPRYVRVRGSIRSELAVPLASSGVVLGVVNVDSTRLEAFREEDQELLQELATQATAVIRNTWRYEQFRLKAQLLESLVKVGQSITAAWNVPDALSLVTREACRLVRARVSSLLLVDPSREWLDIVASHGAGPGYLRKPRVSIAESLVGAVVRRRKPIQVEDVRGSNRYQNVDVARREGLVSLLSVPLVHRGEAIGVLNVYQASAHRFSNDEIRVLSALADLSALAIERARLYERVVDLEELMRQRERLSALGLLAAEVAHEIRNPLTVLKMLYHSLKLNFLGHDPRARDARIIGEKMEHLNRIVDRILDFARTSEPDTAQVDVRVLIEEVVLLTRHKLASQTIRLVQRTTPDLPMVLGDSVQLSQVFLNLILNALEAMPEGGRLTIATRHECDGSDAPEGGRVVIEFRDTGEGMSRRQQQRLFDSLLQTTKNRGTGLGLAIVGRIVESHRGELQVKSRRGRGTTMRVLLPRAN